MESGGKEPERGPAPGASGEAGFAYCLRDGTPAFMRPVGPQDRERIRVGVSRMSRDSRYLRFFTGSSQLSDEQLRYFTQLDQYNHVAWCALDPLKEGLPGFGLGRFVRVKEEPGTAEWALAVIDDYQGKGLGRVLLGMLYVVAQWVGLQTLRGLVLPENEAVLAWQRRLGASIRREPMLYVVELPVVADPAILSSSPCMAGFARLVDELRELASPFRCVHCGGS